MLKNFVTRGKHSRPIKTIGHSRFWQSVRPFHCSIRQSQLSGFASRQSECPAGHAKSLLHTRPVPEGHRTRATSVSQPFPTAVFAAVSPDGENRSYAVLILNKQFHKQRQ